MRERSVLSVTPQSHFHVHSDSVAADTHLPGDPNHPSAIMSEVSDTIGIPRRREGENDEQAARGRAKGFEGQVPEMVLPSRSSSAHPVAAGGCAGDRSEHCVPTVRSHQPPGQLQLFTWLLPHLPEKNEALLSPPERP